LEITKSRASRHLANLELLGIVARVSTGRGYQLGWRVLRWGQIASTRYDLSQLLDSPLRKLGDDTDQTVLLCAPAGADAIVLQCLPRAAAVIRIEVNEGLVMSLPHSPSARISFAFQQREQREILLEHLKQREAEFRIDDEERFRGQVAAIQRDYFCWDRDKYNVGYGAIAAPVFNQDERLAGIITLVMPSGELAGDVPPAPYVRQLVECCSHASRLLGSRMRYPYPGDVS
jgi:DNA-binding IclR family transcriptional regulator